MQSVNSLAILFLLILIAVINGCAINDKTKLKVGVVNAKEAETTLQYVTEKDRHFGELDWFNEILEVGGIIYVEHTFY
jgi:hypothetical protein